MKAVLHWIFYGNIFIAICAVFMTLETYLILHIPVTPDTTFPLFPIIFCSTFFIYNIDLMLFRYNPLDEIAKGRPGWRIRHSGILKRINIVVGFLILLLSFFSSYKTFFFFAHLAAISLAYYFSFEIGWAKFTPLRRIPLMKAFVITYIWAGSSVLLPALRNGIDPGSIEVLLVFAERYLFLFALAIIFDIRDLRFDIKDIRTIPGMFGVSKTKIISYSLLALATILVCIHYKDLYMVAAFVVSFVIASFLVNRAKSGSGEYFFLLLLDGAMIFQCMLVFLSLNK